MLHKSIYHHLYFLIYTSSHVCRLFYFPNYPTYFYSPQNRRTLPTLPTSTPKKTDATIPSLFSQLYHHNYPPLQMKTHSISNPQSLCQRFCQFKLPLSTVPPYTARVSATGMNCPKLECVG